MAAIEFSAASVSAQANVIKPLRSRPHLKKKCILVQHLPRGELLQRADVIQDVNTTTVRADDQIVVTDRKSTRLNSSHANISYAVFCLRKKTQRSPAT